MSIIGEDDMGYQKVTITPVANYARGQYSVAVEGNGAELFVKPDLYRTLDEVINAFSPPLKKHIADTIREVVVVGNEGKSYTFSLKDALEAP